MSSSEFAWLTDLHRLQCYTTGDWNNPAKTIDFGDNGYTASLTDWHELLQLTAPDPLCGIVTVRGDFPNTADAILARAQHLDHSGNKGTFGLELDPTGSDFALGERRNQGFVNFRWPYVQYELRRKYPDGGVEQIHAGTYEAISFVKDGVVFQVICVRPGRFRERSNGFGEETHDAGQDQGQPQMVDLDDETAAGQNELKIRFKMGGSTQFGCACSGRVIPDDDGVETFPRAPIEFSSQDEGNIYSYINRDYEKRLEMQFFVNDEPKMLQARPYSEPGSPRGGIGCFFVTHDVKFEAGSTTFIVATFALKDFGISEPLLRADSFGSIASHLGIPNNSYTMTDRLWTACLTTNYDAPEALEFCAIGTAVEQTLCVASVPVSLKSNDETELNVRQSQSQIDADNEWEYTGVALIHNIIIGQHVDLQSTFWQVRLLAKVHNFLRSRKFDPDLLNSVRPLLDIRNSYLGKLRNHIRKTLVWLTRATIEPGKIILPVDAESQLRIANPETTSSRVMHDRALLEVEDSLEQGCYVTLTVWFVMKHCPEAITANFKTQIILPALKKVYAWIRSLESQDGSDLSPKSNVLRWLQLSCFILICQENFGRGNQDQNVDGFTASEFNRHDISRSQERCEKSITRLRKGKNEVYSVEDEELDRLFLLADELGFNALRSQTSSSLAIARARQTRAKISERKPTTRFHPGPKLLKPGDTAKVISNGPWELSCLNHHALLRAALDRSFDISVQECRDACFEFLLSDYSFMSSWDRADKAMIGHWWDFEIGSVICATLLDLKSAGILKSAEPELKPDDLSQSVTDSAMAPVEGGGQVNPNVVTRAVLPRTDSLRDLLQLLQQELLQNKSGGISFNKPFNWLAWKPAQLYHPICWVKLMNGSTKVQNPRGTKKLHSQLDIIKYLSGSDENNLSKSLESHMKEIEQLLSEDLDYINIFDMVASNDFNYKAREHDCLTKRSTTHRSSSLRLEPPTTVQHRVQLLQEDQIAHLNRTLVDSGTKYRILFAERCSPSILKAFICGWHPDAADTFDNYFGTSSRFLDSREAMWTTTITISHWGIQNADSAKEYPKRFHEGRVKGDFPPASIANIKLASEKPEQRKPQQDEPVIKVIEERSTSLVITGDSQGFFWTCTMWSSLTKYKHLVTPINSLPAVLQSFIHQQASGRCLVFLVLLGHLCERLAREHGKMLNQLNTVVDLGEKILLQGIKLDASDAVERLERMLWGLEALRVFDDRLSTSLSQIRKARESLEHTIDQEAVQQDVELVQEYKNVLEDFGKRYSILLDVQIKIQLRIRQVTGLRDGISTVTNVRDSRAALEDSKTTIKQGNNIRVLTLITIAYLPLGFVASLFSNNQELLPAGSSTTLYIVLSVVLSLATYVVALTLGAILGFVPRFRHKFVKKFMLASTEGTEAIENVPATKQPSSSRGHGRSRSMLSGSRRVTILPFTKEHEPSDTNV